jgi:hypothetical protein
MSLATADFMDESWRIAEKTPIIAADLAIAVLLYWAIPGGKLKKLLFASLWLFHPTVWYNSALFGQFDPIAAALLLASVILLMKGRDKAAFIVAAFAVLTKQHVFIPVILMAAASIRTLGWRRLLKDFAWFSGVVAVFSIPFMVTGHFVEYARALLFPGQPPIYQTPLMYAFSGWGSLLTYLHLHLGWNTEGFFVYSAPLLLLAIGVGLYFSYKRNITVPQAALVGFLIFIGLFYRINYQYLVIYIPLALLVAAQSRYIGEKVMALVVGLLPAVWLWLFNDSFWLYYIKPHHTEYIPFFERLGLAHNGTPDWTYVTLAMALMLLIFTYVLLVFIRWRKPFTGKKFLSFKGKP